MTAEEQLSTFVAELRADALPAQIADLVQLHILDAVACGMAGVRAEHTLDVTSAARSVFGDGHATVIGGAPMAPAGAALVNGFQIAAPTLGDVHRATLTHVMPEVFPAALAAAQVHGSSGSALLAAVAAGMEISVRVAEALDTPAYRARGFHNPGIAGALGAACAAGRAARLAAFDIRVAMGHAASQAAGTFAALGTDGVKVHQARGAVSGLLAAHLAARGVSASEQALTAERGGLLNAYADGGHPERLTHALGVSWQLSEIAMRRWPGASSLQPAIEATLALRAEVAPDAVVGARVALPPRAYAMHANLGWETRLSALQSARWQVAVALADGDAWLEQTDERLLDVDVSHFALESVLVEEDTALPATGARVTLLTGDGGELARQVDIPAGDPRRPLTRHDLEQKLARAASDGGLRARVASIVPALETLATSPSVDALTDALEVR